MKNPQINNGKRIVRTLSRTVDNAVLLALLVTLVVACFAFWDTHQVYVAAEASHYDTYKPSGEDTKSFEDFRAINSDVIGWITVYDTRIDYPVLHSSTPNEEYLSKNAMKEWEGSGSLFIDHANKSDFSDFNTIIFGHHMTGGAMFGDVDLFLEKDFFDEHKYGNLFFSDTGFELVQKTSSNPGATAPNGLQYEFTSFQGRNHGIEFFAIILADGYDTGIYGVPSVSEEAKQKTLQSIAARAIHVRNLSTGETKTVGKTNGSSLVKTDSIDSSYFGVSTRDKIVLLSTCSADITNGRFVLIGRITDSEISNPFPEEERSKPEGDLDIFNFLDKYADFTIWQWILILVGLIFLTWLLYRAEKSRLKRRQEKKQKALESLSQE